MIVQTALDVSILPTILKEPFHITGYKVWYMLILDISYRAKFLYFFLVVQSTARTMGQADKNEINIYLSPLYQ